MTELNFLHFKEIQLCHAPPSTFNVQAMTNEISC